MSLVAALIPYGNSLAISASTTSANTSVTFNPGQTPQTVYVVNTSAAVAGIVFGYFTSAPTALLPTSGSPANAIVLPPVGGNCSKSFTIPGPSVPGQTLYVAAILSTGTGTVYFTFGDGQ